MLELALKNILVQIEWNIKEDKEYNVKKILDLKKVNEKDQYLVKWLRYREEKDS